jgi:DNA segregation ATPase FtsK/SpoIIIE-like protein
LDEYNAAVEPVQRLPRIVAVFDEFSTACDQGNGARGELAHLTFQMATKVRKFGINLIFAGQAINADRVGPMRDQITTRVCFQVARREISRTVVYRPGAELTLVPHCVSPCPALCAGGALGGCSAGVARPGHGLTMDGLWQAYY